MIPEKRKMKKPLVRFLLPLSSAGIVAFAIGFLQSAVAPTSRSANADEAPAAGAAPDPVKAEAEKTEMAKADAAAKPAAEDSATNSASNSASNSATNSATKRVLAKGYQGCLTDEVALQDVKAARAELEKLKRDLDKRESELNARAKAVSEELAKLEGLQKDLKTAQGASSAKDEEKIAKLVETFESMSPKSAAAILATLDRSLAVSAMNKVSAQKLGKILSAMPTNKSTELTEALAGVVPAKGVGDSLTKEPSNGGSLTANAVKGGDKDENQQSKQSKHESVPSQTASENGKASGREPASTGPSGRTPAR